MRRMFVLLIGAILLSVGQSWGDPVIEWNKAANDVFLKSGRPAGAVTLDMAYMHIAIYDAVNAIDGRHIPYAVIPPNSAPWASMDAATAAAARRVLLTFYASQQAYIDSVYGAALALLPDDSTKARGVAIGDTVATRFLALRAGDGRNADVPYTFGSGPGVYQLTPGAPAPPATPQAPWIAHFRPFAMVSDSQFRAPAPPALTSDLYARDFNESKRYGAHDSSARTAEQTAIGQFYGENPGNQLSRNIRNLATAHGLSVAENARLFVQLYVTIADAVIAGWDSKYHYNCWRPVTAIRAADTDGNPQTLQDTSWLPLLVTPGHPEYPAAHGCVTGGLAYAIERFFNTDHQDITLTSTFVPGAAITEHHFTNIQDIVSEVINARVYGGMHYRTSGEQGAAIARKVADWVADHYFKPKSADIPTAGLQLWLEGGAGVDTLNGRVNRWHDQSGNGNDVIQASASRQPLLVAGQLNGKPVVRFDGVNDKLGFTGSTLMTQFSLFVVLNNHAGAPGNDGNVITFGASGGYPHQWFMIMRYPNTPDSIAMGNATDSYVNAFSHNLAAYDQWRNLSIVSTGPISSTTLRWDGNNAHIALDGFDQSISFPLGDATGSGGGIGGADGVPAGTILAKCDVAEILVYNTALTDSARRTVESYLATKYGLPQPPSIPSAGLQLWLKADAGVDTLNGTVSRWHDQSGHGNDAIQANVSRQPLLVAGALNGRPVLRFDGANDRLGLTGTTPMHQISMFLVFKVDSGATGAHPDYPICLGGAYEDGHVYGLSMRNNFSGNSPNIIDPWTGGGSWLHETLPGIAAFGQWKVVSITTDKTIWNTNLWAGGTKAVRSPQGSDLAINVPLGSADGLGVGGIGGADNVPDGTLIFKGDIAEVMVYDTVLVDADRQAVENYLNAKYQTATAVAQSPLSTKPEVTRLEQNYPNPFNPSTSIQYQLSAPSHVTLKVFDVLGREVATLVDENKPSGIHSVRFDGARFASGVYFFRLQAGSLLQTRKMVLTK